MTEFPEITNRTGVSNPLGLDESPNEAFCETSTAPSETAVNSDNQSLTSLYYSRVGINTAQRNISFFNQRIADNSTENKTVSDNTNAASRLNGQLLDSLENIRPQGKRGVVSASIREARSDAPRITPELKARFERIGQKYGIPPALIAGMASRESGIGGEFAGKTGKNSVLHGWSDFRNGSYQGFGILSVDKKTAAIPASEKKELQNAYGKMKMDPYSEKHIEQFAKQFKVKMNDVERRFPNLSKDAQLATAVSRYNGGSGKAFPNNDRGTTGKDYANDTLVRARYFAQNWGQLAGGKTTSAGSNSSTVSSNTLTGTNAAPTDSTAGALARGQKGEPVMELQRDLIKLGQMTVPQVKGGEGIFGPKTEAAVKTFQKNLGLAENGRLDDVTGRAMNAVLGAVRRDDKSNPKLIETIQNKLVSLGYMTKEQIGNNAGTFGPKTEAALKKFQNDHDLPTTGRFGRLTYDALLNSNTAATKPVGETTNAPVKTVKRNSASAPTQQSTTPTAIESRSSAQISPKTVGRGKMPNTTNLSAAQKYDVYADFVNSRGNAKAQKDLAAGKRVILGLRHETDIDANRRRGIHDDRIIVMWQDKDGTKHVHESLTANTEPSGKWRTDMDADRDGRGDLGRLKEGTLEYSKSRRAGFGPAQEGRNNILRPTRPHAVERDSNHDGIFDRRDAARNKNKSALTDRAVMYFHRGGVAGRAGRTGSAGCQTMPQKDFNKFWESLGGQKKFQYVLVNID